MIKRSNTLSRDDKTWLFILVMALTLISLLSACDKQEPIEGLTEVTYQINGDHYTVQATTGNGKTMLINDLSGPTEYNHIWRTESRPEIVVRVHQDQHMDVKIIINGETVRSFSGDAANGKSVFLFAD